MKKSKNEEIALFRFGIIHPFIGLKDAEGKKKEALIREITTRKWDIPCSSRSYICRSVVLEWLKRYRESGAQLNSLEPKKRNDRGVVRCLDPETETALIQLKTEKPHLTLPVLLREARNRKIIPADAQFSPQSIYRIFQRNGLDQQTVTAVDRRRFEVELPNDLWQCDCMHGSLVVDNDRFRKSFLFAFIDDHSRIIPHAQFYLQENLLCFMDCLKQALSRRGLPRRIYMDNGPSFLSRHLDQVAASLGIALIHCTPYTPEGKGKIERWFKTVRSGFLPTLPSPITLEELNQRLHDWIEKDYHVRIHSSTREEPLKRYARHLQLLRPAPLDFQEHFRKREQRKVYRDRTISLNGRAYEAPVQLIGRTVTLFYHPEDPDRVEVFHNDRSYGFLASLNLAVNARIRRNKDQAELVRQTEEPIRSGLLFERGWC